MSETSSVAPGAQVEDDTGGVVFVGESNNNQDTVPQASVNIGEPKDSNYNPFESVLWTHSWFRKLENPQSGVCLLCEADNAKLPANAKKKKVVFSASNWSTSGMFINDI